MTASPLRTMRRLALWPLLLAVACGTAATRDASRDRPDRASRSSSRDAAAQPDTGVFVAQQSGAPTLTSAVMLLRATARNAVVTLANEAGQEAVAGAPGEEPSEEIPGSRAATVADSVSLPLPAGWRAGVSAPVLEGERYLLEIYPSSPRQDSVRLDLSADAEPLAASTVSIDATAGPALFELAVGKGRLSVGPQIEPVEIVPSCGTSHLVRSGGRADLYAQYDVVETRERGDVHLPPRDADARFRAVTFRTRTRGTLRISYLGHELASASVPEACPAS